MSDRVSLAPIDEAAGLWAIERWAKSGWHWRSPVVCGPDAVTVVSPTIATRSIVGEELAALGPLRALLAPNYFHYLGLAEYAGGNPDCLIAASDIAAPRIGKKTGLAVGPLEALCAFLPSHVEVLEPPGIRAGEVWLRVETGHGITWVVSDAFFNLAEHPSGGMGLACRVLGVSRGLRIGRTFTALALGDRATYRAWLLEQLERDRPRSLVPSHGDIAAGDDLPERLRALIRQRLGDD